MNNNSLMYIKGQASRVNFLLQISIFCQKFPLPFYSFLKKLVLVY